MRRDHYCTRDRHKMIIAHLCTWDFFIIIIIFETREQGKKLSLAKATAILERTELIIQTMFLWKNGAVEIAVCPCACKKVEVEKRTKTETVSME